MAIKNADKAIATASGEIKVGIYQFQLTVKDVEELKSTSTLKVDVKKGMMLLFTKHSIISDVDGVFCNILIIYLFLH